MCIEEYIAWFSSFQRDFIVQFYRVSIRYAEAAGAN